ncbi:MAG: Ger(x)C family spore germination C-terminal domain-containing protein [Eubacteriales bacterium]
MKKLLPCLLACILLLTSCGMGEEIDTLGIVVGVAFDKPETEGNINMTACILRVNGGGADSEEGGSEGGGKDYIIVNSEAPSFYEAQSRMMLKIERRPFWGHNNIILASQDTDLKPIMQAFYNGYDKRGSEYVVIVKGKAETVLASSNFVGSVGAVSINEILGMSKENGFITDVNVDELYAKMHSKSGASYLPYGETEDKKFTFKGLCVVRDYAFKGSLSADESVGSLIVLNDYKSGGISVPIGNAVAGVELLDTSCSVDCTEDKFFTIKVNAAYSVQDINGQTKMDNETVENLVNAAIKDKIQKAILKSIQLDADYMNFSDDYFRKFAKAMPDDFKYSQFNITVNGKLKFKGIEY